MKTHIMKRRNTKQYLFETMGKLGIPVPEEQLNEGRPFEPMSLLHRAIRSGLVKPEEYFKNAQQYEDIAGEIADEYSDFEEWGSSDMTAAIKNFMDYVGIPNDFVQGRLTRTGDPKINENSDVISSDPTKEEMVNFLNKEFNNLLEPSEIATEFDLESAIYWFANHYHGGQTSNLYSVLSTSQYRPGPMHRSVEDEGEVAAMMYNALVDKFSGDTSIQEGNSTINKNGGVDNYMKRAGLDDESIKNKVEKMKRKIDDLYLDGDIDSILGLATLLRIKDISEDHSPAYEKKVELLKGKLDFYYDNDYYDIIEKLEKVFDKLYTEKAPETEYELDESVDGEIYFNTQSGAVQAAVEKARARGFEVNDQDVADSVFAQGWVGYENNRKDSIPIYKNGKPQRKALQISLYRMPSGKYELTTYIN